MERRRERWMWLRGGVVFVEDILKSRVGKILRGVLKERVVSMGEVKKVKF